MPFYDVTAWKDFTHYSTLTIEADTPAAAIEIMHQRVEDADADWEACDDGGSPVHHMIAEPNIDVNDPQLCPDEPENNAEWDSPTNVAVESLQNAAKGMLAALETIQALPTAAVDCVRGGVDLPAIIAQAKVAGIAQADPPGRDDWSRLQIGRSLMAELTHLTNWAREHTSPRDANSPHEILIRAAQVLTHAKNAGITSDDAQTEST